MRPFHTLGRISTVFDDPNLVGSAGLVPVMRRQRLAADHGESDRGRLLPVRVPRQLEHRTHHVERRLRRRPLVGLSGEREILQGAEQA